MHPRAAPMNRGVLRLNKTSVSASRGPVAFAILVLAACGGGSGGSGSSTPPTYTIGGTVTGLSGSGLMLRNFDGDELPITGNGSFTFGVHVTSGAAYNVAV